MYISRFSFNRARRQTRLLLANPQALHAQVLESFAPSQHTETSAGRVLWRVDSDVNTSTLFITSPERPDLTAFVEGSGWPTSETWQTREYIQRIESIRLGQKWGFRFTGNPVSTKRQDAPELDKRPRGVRVPHVTPEQQLNWLLERSNAAGFMCVTEPHPEVSVSNRREVRFHKNNLDIPSSRKNMVTLRTAQFDGLLTVTNADAFKRTLTFGLGPAKGYGCGLLTVAPLIDSPK